jgi:hypothetical protein
MSSTFHLFERECDDSSHPMFCAACLTYQLRHKPDNLSQLHHMLNSSETYQVQKQRQSKIDEFFSPILLSSTSSSSSISTSSFPSSYFQSSSPSYGLTRRVCTVEEIMKRQGITTEPDVSKWDVDSLEHMLERYPTFSREWQKVLRSMLTEPRYIRAGYEQTKKILANQIDLLRQQEEIDLNSVNHIFGF